ncbi:hypothetical protein BGW36DRAFT_448809 [Talaromyces proteolyticus]|uniref:DUF1772-domain-containing protein n=1 Tax=Talaromyces proteolyticus TaxID=1131652 RepID=A0AAD4Q1Q1_9EURO|nr:uncharacterized protein BGW36DRAFT_448809 [Talaromyces proteolyticus]KAH8698788.1 hypothetical protein BGW36DRAFT_448809 [Talaromyces proteolyticus]
MSSYSLAFRAVQVLGITGAAWLSGNISVLSMNAIPRLAHSGREHGATLNLVAKQWNSIYDTGKAQNPPIAILITSSFLYLAWATRSGGPFFRQARSSCARFYFAAALLTLSIVPFTLILMNSTNTALRKLAASSEESSRNADVQSASLLERWVTLNGIRGLLPLAGSVVGLIGALV